MTRLLTLRRNLARLLTRDEVDDNFVNVASDFSGAVDPATLTGAYVAPYMRWADTGTGWLKRRNSANDGWVSEQRLLRRTVQPFNTSELPTADGGPIYVNGQGMAEFDATAGKYRVVSPVPVGAVAWWPLRSSIPAGRIPADGQSISRATFPDLAAMVLAGTVPVATESDWLADPRNRGCYTVGDGSTTIRVPDLNGRSAGSLGRVFLSGDGTDSNGVWGGIQRDQFQKHHHYINIKTASGGADVYGQSNYGAGSGPQYSSVGEAIQFDPQVGPPRSGDKTHPQNVTGVWTIQAFGAVTNPGSVDAAQLASDYAALNAAFQTMRGQVFGFNQTWQNVTASRSLGVIYTNTTGRPILVQVYTTSTAAAGYLFFAIDETPAGLVYYQNSAANLPGCILVPAGSTYRASTTNASLSGWREYR
ncbi:phage tail protein [Achromobacter xylosoxidans]|uniref:phage tail protein n=1 Tax=Alcaligenes xylosoxydans xylosoxydans TaxID=85698 RepID=UPI0006C2E46C|nr:phage tail protein [Achromobacter xylosoxidans]QQE57334.1 tail fiber protein [Achromobacter xylosoxidans]QQV16973.1 tail fiber protein [Achromobacter xylosoxidans]CUI50646.1 Phage Tail Collar Domain [Achromobacter xylosoxidans]